ncbi:hypothetical protein JXB27_00850 [Candidatus Woesearchaeota archaeon]|nr:hypothetical protein [Candidatus Woesearchaeota archaeon]
MSKKPSKKADVAFEKLVVIIAAFIFLLAMIPVVNYILSKDEDAAKLVCHNSVLLRQKAAVDVPVIGEEGSPLLCPTTTMKISGNDEKIKREIANLIADTWWQFGEGRFEDVLKEGTAGGKHECAIRYVLLLKNPDFKISANEFANYLAKTTYKFVAEEGSYYSTADKPVTYLDYIQKSEGGTGNIFLSDIEAPQTYAIAFGSPTVKPGAWISVPAGGGAVLSAAFCFIPAVGWAACGGAVVVGAVTGAYFLSDDAGEIAAKIFSEREVSSIYVVPLEELMRGEHCVMHK